MKEKKYQVSTSLTNQEVYNIKEMAEDEMRSFAQMMRVLLQESIKRRILIKKIET